ncbi:hypothetical protein EDWATA_03140 [Edwardsiella tarda ATCC 23685]|uniref:Uncharacterized protein n=1 Tax=Edwardsiella tarda ATCC 23685 TaxID=500638 RepID=D4F8P0_EDWTA|nr:hypothetical protein EDWATA_03140 [Edwardsiella tarda ATCC 23685]
MVYLFLTLMIFPTDKIINFGVNHTRKINSRAMVGGARINTTDAQNN